MKKTMIITLTLTLILATTMLLAQGTPKGNPKVPVGPKVTDNPNLKSRLIDDGTGMGRIQELDLSEKQLKKLDELRMEHQKRMNTAQAEIENLHLDIEAALKADDYKRAKELTTQVFNKKAALAVARIDHMQSMMKELNAEQKIKARQMFMPRHMIMMRQMHMDHMQGKGMMPGMGQGMGMHRRNNYDDCDDCSGHDPQNLKPGNQKPR